MSILEANVYEQTDKLCPTLWGFMVFPVKNRTHGFNICAPKEDGQTGKIKKQTGVRKKCDGSQTNRCNKYPERLTIYDIDCSRRWRAFFLLLIGRHRHALRDERWRDYRHPHMSCRHGSPHLNVPPSAGMVSDASRRYWPPKKNTDVEAVTSISSWLPVKRWGFKHRGLMLNPAATGDSAEEETPDTHPPDLLLILPQAAWTAASTIQGWTPPLRGGSISLCEPAKRSQTQRQNS